MVGQYNELCCQYLKDGTQSYQSDATHSHFWKPTSSNLLKPTKSTSIDLKRTNDPVFAAMIKNHTELRVDLRRRTLIDIKALWMGIQIDSTVPGAGAGEIPRAVLTQNPAEDVCTPLSFPWPLVLGSAVSWSPINIMGAFFFCAQWSCVLRMQRLHVCLSPSPLRQELSHTNMYTMVSGQWLCTQWLVANGYTQVELANWAQPSIAMKLKFWGVMHFKFIQVHVRSVVCFVLSGVTVHVQYSLQHNSS